MKRTGIDARAVTAADELLRLRTRIDELDRRIVALLNERAELGIEIGRAKASAGRTVMRVASAGLGVPG